MTAEDKLMPASSVAVIELPETAAAPKPKLTYEEFIAQTNDGTWAEWVDGEVLYMTVANENFDVTFFLAALLRLFAETHDLGRVFGEPFQMKTAPHLPGRAPDAFFVAKENLVHLKRFYFNGPADLVIEVISTESRSRDRGEKFYEYEEGGVREYWLIDPQRKQAEFYQREATGFYRAIPTNETGIYHSQVLPGLWIKVEWLWQEPLPPLLSVLKEWKLI
jgi:Uma2 family endonuclease